VAGVEIAATSDPPSALGARVRLDPSHPCATEWLE
jgi:hypothetical protein